MTIDASFIHGSNFKCGKLCVIEPNAIVGNNVSLGNHVTLKSGTRFGDNVHFGDYCRTTGLSYLGNHVNVRTGATISRSVIVEDCAFIGPGVMTNHTKHVVHMRPHLEAKQLITHIGYGAVIGSTVSMVAGVRIGDNVIIGAGALVTKDVLIPAIYVEGENRGKLIKLSDLPKNYYLKKPSNYKEHTFPKDMLRKYLPHYKPKEVMR